MELSTEIKEARRKLGLSQSQAAKAWSVPVRTLQQWEQGKQVPRGFALAKLREIIAAAMAANTGSAPSASPDSPGEASSKTPPKSKRRGRPKAKRRRRRKP